MTPNARIAVLGDALGPVEQTVRVLRERGVALEGIRVAGTSSDEGRIVEVDDAELRVGRVGEVDAKNLEAVVLLGRVEEATPLLGRWADSCVVVDASPGAALRLDRPPLVPEVNAAEAGSGPMLLPLASPDAAALAAVVAPIRARTRIRRVFSTVLVPASSAGEDGAKALSRQAVGLMQGQGIDDVGEGNLRAFNLVPHPGAGESAWSADELLLSREVVGVFRDPTLSVTATFVHAPVFYGTAQSVFLETDTPLETSEVEGLLRAAPGIILAELGGGEEKRAGPGPIGVLGSDAIHVARIRSEGAAGSGIALWLCFDEQRKGLACNAVSVVEAALRVGGD